MIVIAMNLIFVACLLYTIGVWAEKLGKRLKLWHVLFFWCGVVFDTVGTGAMGVYAGSLFQLNFHGITGMAAILLMLFHAIWASAVIALKAERIKLVFHRFSIAVWIIWLVPMVSGIVFGAMA
jgi:uncharacterized repeat protein (TIGR03987 family)